MLSDVEFFKIQAKNFYKDWQIFISNCKKMNSPEPFEKCRFFDDDIFLLLYVPQKSWDDMHANCRLMRAQHYIAHFAGFTKWNELIKASPIRLKAAKIIFAASIQYGYLPDEWIDYQKDKHLEKVDDETYFQLTQNFFKHDFFLNINAD